MKKRNCLEKGKRWGGVGLGRHQLFELWQAQSGTSKKNKIKQKGKIIPTKKKQKQKS